MFLLLIWPLNPCFLSGRRPDRFRSLYSIIEPRFILNDRLKRIFMCIVQPTIDWKKQLEFSLFFELGPIENGLVYENVQTI